VDNEFIARSLANKLSKDPNFAFCILILSFSYDGKSRYLDVYWYSYAGKWDGLESWCGIPVFHMDTSATREQRSGKPNWLLIP